ncbi:MAG: DJ-1/PfpI family protein [Gemmataceae bacterium]
MRSTLIVLMALVGVGPAGAAELPLKGCRVAIILATGYHDHEFWFPYYRFQEAGAEVIVAGPAKGTVYGEGRNGKDGLPANITHTIEEIKDQRFDLVYLPGGIWAPLKLRHDKAVCELVRKSLDNDVVVAAICHASWVLVSADVVKGKKIACPPDMAVDVKNAGGNYVKDKCVQDGNLITAVYFAYLPEQFRVLMPVLEQRMKKNAEARKQN